MQNYPVVQVPDDAPWSVESQGTKSKFWYRDESGKRFLYKAARAGTGEDWAEVIAAQIANLLHLPHAQYSLAVHSGTRGVVTETIVPRGGDLRPGNVLLKARVQNYPDDPSVKQFKNTQHTLTNIRETILDLNVGTPLEWHAPPEIINGFDLMLGYLFLDAVIGNTDRHHENWAIIGQISQTNTPIYTLAPTYDHGSSLGRDLTDKERKERMTTRDSLHNVVAYTKKTRSAIYANETDSKPMSPLNVFRSGWKYAPVAGNYWLKQLDAISIDVMRKLFDGLPPDRISHEAIEFASTLLEINRTQLLNLREESE